MAKHAATRLQGGRHRAEGRNPVIIQPLSITGVASGYIGRVSALALALGVGAAVSTGFGMGIAHAQNGGGTDTQSADAPADPKRPHRINRPVSPRHRLAPTVPPGPIQAPTMPATMRWTSTVRAG